MLKALDRRAISLTSTRLRYSHSIVAPGLEVKILSNHAAGFLENDEHEYAPKWGRLRDVVQRSFEAFLECGLPESGFARVRCGTCHDEYLLPFSCQIRGPCTSCSAKRCAAFGKWVTEELVRGVPHQHVVVGLPKMLRQRSVRLLLLPQRAKEMGRLRPARTKRPPCRRPATAGPPGSIALSG